MHTTSDAYQLDVSATELTVDPYRTYARLRANRGVHYRSDAGGNCFPVLSRYADVHFALRDPRFGRGDFGAVLRSGLGDGPLSRSFARWMLFRDPPDHTRLRSLVNQAFTPQAVERLRDKIAEIVVHALDRLAARSSFDLIAEFAAPLPVLVICELLGVPDADRREFAGWSSALAASLDHLTRPEPLPLARGNAAADGLTAYFRDLLATRRNPSGDDLLSGLLQAAGSGGRLTEDELLATCVLLFFAGHETSVNLIGNGMLALLTHPDQFATLQQAPDTAAAAVEELLRFDSPVQRTARVALATIDLPEGNVIQKGELVTILIGAANRDSIQFLEADRLDLARPNASRHLAFGAGIHYCLGAPLARLEAQIALTELVRRIPNMHLTDASPAWRPILGLRGLQALHVAS